MIQFISHVIPVRGIACVVEQISIYVDPTDCVSNRSLRGSGEKVVLILPGIVRVV